MIFDAKTEKKVKNEVFIYTTYAKLRSDRCRKKGEARKKSDRKKPNRKEVIQTKKPKCENCGEPTLKASMRELALWICPHFEGLTRLSVTASALYCENGEPSVKRRKGRCSYCDSKLLSAYLKSGLCVWVCPHTKIRNLDTVNKALYCSTITHDTQSMTYLKSRYPKAITQAVNVRALRVAFKELTKNTELTLAQLRRAVHETASEESILEFANIAIMLGLPIEKLPELFGSAMKLGHATGIDTKSAIQALSIGVGRQSRMVLDNIGIMFKAQDAYATFPKLNRVDAWKRYALQLITEKSAKLSTDPKKIEKLQHDAHVYNMHTKLGENLLTQQSL